MAAFRLARVLHLRTQLRRLRMHEAETLGSELARLRRQAASLAARREEWARIEAATASDGVDATVFQVGRAYDDALADEERACGREQERVTAALLAKRAEVEAERREERKIEQLERLHDAREAEDEAHRLATLLDELALRRHATLNGGRS
ncbi:MAG TPA: hypothetical protein VGK30_17040 [Candidatus Binatia bacterium]|jgi:hypothetical protein